ncbi:MAG TPA: hypothetical protein V6D19_02160 [Stenomitos sp.]
MSTPDDFRPVNQLLGTSPNIGPIPANQFIPWIAIILIGLSLGSFFGMPWQWCLAFIFWGIATYWLLTGNHPWRFLARFIKSPHWIPAHPFYISPLEEVRSLKRKPPRSHRHRRPKR